jgi:hypothetical protein
VDRELHLDRIVNIIGVNGEPDRGHTSPDVHYLYFSPYE